MYNKIIFLLLITALFSGCAKQISNQNQQPIAPQNQIEDQDKSAKVLDNKKVAGYDCQANEIRFADYFWFFEEKDYLTWCEECVNSHGRSQVSHDAGPFCNKRTNDAGKSAMIVQSARGIALLKTKMINPVFVQNMSNSGMIAVGLN